jgi:DNA replication and repair protein RecF
VRLTTLQLEQFRNFSKESVGFCDGLNLLVGRNGQGKTNLLEAMYLLGYGKTYRTALARECIRHGQAECGISGIVAHGGVEKKLQVRISPSDKELTVHGKCVALDEFAGQFHVVAFTQGHISVIRGAPAERRAFLDRALVMMYPGHVRHIAGYVRALKHRNSLLSGGVDGQQQVVDERQMETWDETVAREGARLIWNRVRYVKDLKQQLPQALFGAEELKLHYIATVRGDLSSTESIEKSLREGLFASRSVDQRLGFTTVGPHRDDLKIFIDGKPAAHFGSAGQQRSAMLSLYFAQMEMHRRDHGYYPVFLVDDVEAELDTHRLRIFLSYLAERTQTFLTTAKPEILPPMSRTICRYRVESGTVVRLPDPEDRSD